MSQEIQIDSLPAEFGWDVFAKAWKLFKRHWGNYMALTWGWMIPATLINYYIAKIPLLPIKVILTLAMAGGASGAAFIILRVQRRLLESQGTVDLIEAVKLATQNLNLNAVLVLGAIAATGQIVSIFSGMSFLYLLCILVTNLLTYYYVFLCEVKNLDPVSACKFSVRAVMFNILPMIVTFLTIMLWSILSVFTLFTGLLVLLPVSVLASLLFANEIFGGANFAIANDDTQK